MRKTEKLILLLFLCGYVPLAIFLLVEKAARSLMISILNNFMLDSDCSSCHPRRGNTSL